MIAFAAITPHAPVLLPDVSSEFDRIKVKDTIKNLQLLGIKMRSSGADKMIMASPHPDWGFKVPLYFLLPKKRISVMLNEPVERQIEAGFLPIKKFLLGNKPPLFYFGKGKEIFAKLSPKRNYALIASGDLSHRLSDDSPYGYHSDGPKFEQAFINAIEDRKIDRLLRLSDEFPDAGECGLRTVCFILGILEAAGQKWRTEMLSYEAPFGVGYLTANLRLKT